MHNVAQLRRLRDRFPDTLVVIGVHSAKFPSERLTENIREAVLRHGIDHPVINDAGFKVWNAYNVHAWPTVVLIDPRGRVVGAHAGEIEADEYVPILEDLVERFETLGELDRQPLRLQPEAAFEPDRALSFPSRLLILETGRAFLADTHHHRIIELELDAEGDRAEIVRVFGSGIPGLRDGASGDASFQAPHGMALLGERLYVADTDNHAIRVIDLKEESVHTAAGTGEKGRGRVSGEMPTEIPLRSPWAVLVLADATEEGHDVLLIAMAGSHQIWILLDERRIGVFAGNGREALVDGPLAEASFNQPSDLSLGLGHLFVADAEASAIRAVSLGEEPSVFTLIGQGLFEFGDVDGIGAEVRLQHAAGILFEGGTLYIADSYNHKIKTLDPASGQVKTLAGTGEPGCVDGRFDEARFYQPEGLAFFDGKLYVADTNNHRIRVLDLEARTTSTLILKGLEKLKATADAVGQAGGKEGTRLNDVEVSPGHIVISLNVLIPEGYKLNPEANSTLAFKTEAGIEAQPVAENGRVTIETELTEDREIPLDLTLYYCQAEDERLCLIHDERLLLPVRIVEGAGDAVHLDYPLEPIKPK